MEPKEMSKDEMLMWYAKSLRQHEVRFANMMITDLKGLTKNNTSEEIDFLIEKYQLYIDVDK